jgi:hypothetical protein
MFCGLFEITDHFFVECSYINYIWQWISHHNIFVFQGKILDDLSVLNASIPFKDIQIVEMIRGAMLWTI